MMRGAALIVLVLGTGLGLGLGLSASANSAVGRHAGATKATGTLTSDGTAPADNDTVTIGSTTYTFRTTLTGAANEVLIGASAAAALTDLKAAINATAGAGTTYGTGTTANADATAGTLTSTTLALTAKVAGTAGNSVATTETSSHLSFGAATLTGAVAKRVRSAGKVVLFGTQSRPIFRVTGKAMHVPRARPGGSPSGKRLCSLRISGNAGHDYGDSMYVIVQNRQGKRLYGAGRYHPKFNELDCIGLIVLSHSRTHITFTFGHAYMQYSYPRLRNGHRVKVVVGSMTRRIVARHLR
jgi:hypothetical protein